MTGGPPTRREYLRRSVAALSLVGTGTLAGCPRPNETVLDSAGESDGTGGSDGATDSVGTSSSDGSASEPTPTEEPPPIPREPDYGDWFANVSNYHNRTAVYPTGRNSIPVTVGASGNGGFRAFHKPAIAIPVETAIDWEWTGDGGRHNVVAVDDTFDSGEPVAQRDEPFRYNFTEPGTYRYFCEPHRDRGMKAVVVVYEPEE